MSNRVASKLKRKYGEFIIMVPFTPPAMSINFEIPIYIIT